jgi:hypothetical protein
MNIFYLKFKNQEELESTFLKAKLAEIVTRTIPNIDGSEKVESYIQYNVILDIIGLMYSPTGVMLKSKEGFKYPEMKQQTGWFANLKAELLPEQVGILADFITPVPETPSRVWAGD